MAIREPIPYPQCFILDGERKYSTQKAYASAAVLFGIGYQLDGNYVPLPGYEEGGRLVEENPTFPLPRLEPSDRRFRRTSREEFQRFEREEVFQIERLDRNKSALPLAERPIGVCRHMLCPRGLRTRFYYRVGAIKPYRYFAARA